MYNNFKKSYIFLGTLAIVVLIFGLLGSIYTYISELSEIGYTSVFYTNLGVGAVTSALLFTSVFILAYIWFLWIRKNLRKATFEEGIFERKGVILLFSLIAGVAVSVFFTRDISQNLLLAINAVKTGKTDPIFGTDLSYYMLVRPLLTTLRDKLNIILIGLFIITVVSYWFYTVRNSEGFNLHSLLNERKIILHLGVNIALIYLVKLSSYRFTMENILFENGERVGGGYTSENIWLNFYKIMPFVLLAIIIFSLIFLYKSKYKLLIGTIAIYPLCFVIATITSVATQQLYVKPNEGSMESKYIAYNIEATRSAYNLSDTKETVYPVTENLTIDDISGNRQIINNIRITDHQATLTAYNQLQGIRNFYQFLDADIIPYTENGQRKAAFISTRELSQTGELDEASYVNRRLKYTHGYGIVKSPVNRVANEGQPDFLIKDIPLVYNDTDTKVTQPRIYFGEAKNDYFIVNTTQSELDFDETTTEHIGYKGASGIPMTALNRIVYAVKYADINMLTSSYITNESKLLVNHNVVERIKKAAPFLEIDPDVHIAVDADGSLKWIADCYTYSAYYPYSQYTEGFNYIRNSAKAVVDAYEGTVNFYIIDKEDPIIRTYEKIYPHIFTSNPMSETLRQQMKYPEWLFNVQANIFKKYHITDPATFYAGSDVWAIAREKYGENSDIKNVAPYYNIMSLEGNSPEFIIMLPYTLKNKDNNLVGWLAAQTDGENYGKFISYSFPQGKHVYGTLQIENKIDNDPDISKEITLWSQGGSTVMRGNLLVIPIKNSLVYVEPLYITSQNEASLPEVKRIIVSYGDKIVMEPSLDEAFAKLFGSYSQNSAESNEPPMVITPETNTLLEEIKSEYNNLQNAAAQGDWEAFGKSMNKIEQLLK